MARRDASDLHGPEHTRHYLETDGEYGHDWRNGSSVLLLTTNEDVGRLHPAVVRPGRCLAQVPFERFPRAQAEARLGAGAQVPPESLPLAELYALREERPADDPRRPTTRTPGHAAPRVDARGTSATLKSDPRLATVAEWPQS